MLILIEHGTLYDPEPRGTDCVLIANGKIEKIGPLDSEALDRLGIEHDRIDATDCYVVPGLVDPHQHLLGGSGEGSPALATPTLLVDEIVRGGTTTVVGTLGVDTKMKTMQGLLGRVKALAEYGVTGYAWTGGYKVPPETLTGSVQYDMVLVQECIGAGEIAISDERSSDPSPRRLSQLVRDAHVGGLLTGKAGVTHFHVGDEPGRLAPLRRLVERHAIKPEWMFPTHVQRDEPLLKEAIELAHCGAHVNFDIVDRDLAKWFATYERLGGPAEMLSISSDADSTTPDALIGQLRDLVLHHVVPLERALRLATINPANALKLETKGRLCPGADADVVVLTRDELAVRDVIAGGQRVVAGGKPVIREKFLEKSSRDVAFRGDARGTNEIP